MPSQEEAAAIGVSSVAPALRWPWIGTAILLGGALIVGFIWIVDPLLTNPALSALVTTLTLVLTGVVIAYKSPGETIRETGVAGLGLVLLASAFLTGVLHYEVKWIVVLLACFYGPSLAMVGGWVGEVLQGTLDHHGGEARTIEWAWIAVGVVVGFMLNIYSVLVGHALLGMNTLGLLACFGGSFFVAGYLVGLHSPGITIMEPGLAAIGMVALDATIALLGFRAPFPLAAIVLAMLVGPILALAGGWIGEIVQVMRRAKAKAAGQPPA